MKNSFRIVLVMAIVTLGLYSNDAVMAQGSNLSISVDGENFIIEENEFIKSEGHYYIEAERLASVFDMNLDRDDTFWYFVNSKRNEDGLYDMFTVTYQMCITSEEVDSNYESDYLKFIRASSSKYGDYGILGTDKMYPTYVGKIYDGSVYVSVRFLADCAFYNVDYDSQSNTIILESMEKHWVEPFRECLKEFFRYDSPGYFNLYDVDSDGYPELFIQMVEKIFYFHYNPYTGYVESPLEYDIDDEYIEPDGFYTTIVRGAIEHNFLGDYEINEEWDLSELDIYQHTIIREEYKEGYNKIRESMAVDDAFIPLVPLTEEYIEMVSKMKP